MKLIAFTFCLIFSSSAIAETISISMVGDIGFNKTNHSPHPNYVKAYGQNLAWSTLTEDIRAHLYGDLIFGNIETVVSDVDLPSRGGGYRFISHPNGIKHLIDIGFNLFSMANNHSSDYGRTGMEETRNWMNLFATDYGIVHHGVGVYSEVVYPAVFKLKGKTIAFSAIGINRTGLVPNDTQAGVFNYYDSSHIDAVIKGLAATEADMKIVSIHYGTEKQVELNGGQKTTYRRFVDEAGVNLVIGHHPHVVRPLEHYNNSLIVYSLGNFLLIGAADIDGRPFGRDYGLIAFATFNVDNGAKLSSVEIQPIKRMHYKPYALTGQNASSRIHFLNDLSKSEVGNTGLQFEMNGDIGVWRQ